MSQFIDGLHESTARKIKLQPYHDLGELSHLAVQIEKCNKRKSFAPSRPKSTWSAGSKPFDRTTSTSQRFKGKAVVSNSAPRALQLHQNLLHLLLLRTSLREAVRSNALSAKEEGICLVNVSIRGL